MNKKSRCRMCQKYADFWFEYGTTDGGIEWKGTYCDGRFPLKYHTWQRYGGNLQNENRTGEIRIPENW